jgi:hypothetical protein
LEPRNYLIHIYGTKVLKCQSINVELEINRSIRWKASDRFSSSTTSDISTLVNTEDSHFRLIDIPLNITVLEEKNNRTDNGILNSTENYQLTSDTTRKEEEFKAGFIKTVNPYGR